MVRARRAMTDRTKMQARRRGMQRVRRAPRAQRLTTRRQCAPRRTTQCVSTVAKLRVALASSASAAVATRRGRAVRLMFSHLPTLRFVLSPFSHHLPSPPLPSPPSSPSSSPVPCDPFHFKKNETHCEPCALCAPGKRATVGCSGSSDTDLTTCVDCTICTPWTEHASTACQEDGDPSQNAICASCAACTGTKYPAGCGEGPGGTGPGFCVDCPTDFYAHIGE